LAKYVGMKFKLGLKSFEEALQDPKDLGFDCSDQFEYYSAFLRTLNPLTFAIP